MPKRLYVVQFLDARAGWTDMPQTASVSLKEVADAAIVIANHYTIATRTHQKPKGWVPAGEVEPFVRGERLSLSIQMRESRQEKRANA